MSMINIKGLVPLLSIAVAVYGCGPRSDGRPPLAKVKGVITLDKEPVEGAFITFIPENGRPSVGISNAQGEYTLEYLQNVPGAAIGHHEVRIVTLSGREQGDEIVKERFPEKYNTKTTLTADVVSGENVIDFHLDSK